MIVAKSADLTDTTIVPIDTIEYDMRKAERNAWKSLAGYKFLMFGYYAATWVSLNKLLPVKQPNPFSRLILAARGRIELKDKCPGCGCDISKWVQQHKSNCPWTPL